MNGSVFCNWMRNDSIPFSYDVYTMVVVILSIPLLLFPFNCCSRVSLDWAHHDYYFRSYWSFFAITIWYCVTLSLPLQLHTLCHNWKTSKLEARIPMSFIYFGMKNLAPVTTEQRSRNYVCVCVCIFLLLPFRLVCLHSVFIHLSSMSTKQQ